MVSCTYSNTLAPLLILHFCSMVQMHHSNPFIILLYYVICISILGYPDGAWCTIIFPFIFYFVLCFFKRCWCTIWLFQMVPCIFHKLPFFSFFVCLYQSRNPGPAGLLWRLNKTNSIHKATRDWRCSCMAQRTWHREVRTLTVGMVEAQEREACVESVMPSPSQTTEWFMGVLEVRKKRRDLGSLSLMRFFWISGNQLSGTSFLISWRLHVVVNFNSHRNSVGRFWHGGRDEKWTYLLFCEILVDGGEM